LYLDRKNRNEVKILTMKSDIVTALTNSIISFFSDINSANDDGIPNNPRIEQSGDPIDDDIPNNSRIEQSGDSIRLRTG